MSQTTSLCSPGKQAAQASSSSLVEDAVMPDISIDMFAAARSCANTPVSRTSDRQNVARRSRMRMTVI